MYYKKPIPTPFAFSSLTTRHIPNLTLTLPMPVQSKLSFGRTPLAPLNNNNNLKREREDDKDDKKPLVPLWNPAPPPPPPPQVVAAPPPPAQPTIAARRLSKDMVRRSLMDWVRALPVGHRFFGVLGGDGTGLKMPLRSGDGRVLTWTKMVEDVSSLLFQIIYHRSKLTSQDRD